MSATTVRINEEEKRKILTWLEANNRELKEEDKLRVSEAVHLFISFCLENTEIQKSVFSVKNGSKSDCYSMSDKRS